MNTKKNTLPPFDTSDFYLACFLYSVGFKISTTKKQDDKRISFVFEDQMNRKELVNQFFNNEANVKVKDFTNAIGTLKSMIYNFKD